MIYDDQIVQVHYKDKVMSFRISILGRQDPGIATGIYHAEIEELSLFPLFEGLDLRIAIQVWDISDLVSIVLNTIVKDCDLDLIRGLFSFHLNHVAIMDVEVKDTNMFFTLPKSKGV